MQFIKFRNHKKPIAVLHSGEALFNGTEAIGKVLGLNIMPLNVEPNIEKISYMVKEVLNAGIDTMIGMSIGDDIVKYFKNKGILYTVIKSEENINY